MINLLKETLSRMTLNGKTPEDVLYVSGPDHEGNTVYCTWEEFVTVANTRYDTGYGGQEINPRLMIVGKGWWMDRREYDGSEWWEFVTPPEKPETKGIPAMRRDDIENWWNL